MDFAFQGHSDNTLLKDEQFLYLDCFYSSIAHLLLPENTSLSNIDVISLKNILLLFIAAAAVFSTLSYM
jgi:hypothetical protein